MIITIKGASFSANKIGTLSTYSIKFRGSGVMNEDTSVDRESNTGYTTTITFDEGYELNGSITVTMGGTDITSTAVSGLTITIPTKVTGNVVITVPTKAIVEEPETPVTPTNYTFTIDPTPSTATVTLTASGYTQSGNSITVANGTEVNWSVSADGYTTRTGNWTVNGGNKTENIILTATSGGGDTGDSGNDGAVRFVFADADTYQSGFVNKRSVYQASDSHYYCSIPAANVQSVTITPLMVQEGASTVWYVTYKSDAGTTLWWGCLAEITPNEPITIDFSEMTDGTIYFNDFYDKNGVLQYPRYADIVYA